MDSSVLYADVFRGIGMYICVSSQNPDNCIKQAIKMGKLYFKYSIIVAVIYIPLFFIKQNDYSFLVRNIIGIFYNSLQILCFHAVIYRYIEVVNNKLNLSRYSWYGYTIIKIFVAMIVSIYLGKFLHILENRLKAIDRWLQRKLANKRYKNEKN